MKEHSIKTYRITIALLIVAILALLILYPGGYAEQIGITTAQTTEIVEAEANLLENLTETTLPNNITKETAETGLAQIQEIRQEMERDGLGILYINDSSLFALEAFEKQDYSEVMRIVGDLEERKEKAFEIKDTLRAFELRLEETQGFDITSVQEVLESTKVEFENERYENAEFLLGEAEKKLEDVKAEATVVRTLLVAGRANIVNFVQDNIVTIAIVVAVFIVIGLLSYKKIAIKRVSDNQKELKIEQKVLIELIKKNQEDYFEKGEIPKSTYETKLDEFKRRQFEIKRKMPVLETRLKKLSESRSPFKL